MGDIQILKKLILSAKEGDTDAFEVVYEKLYTPLYRYVMSKCGDTETANDVCQQAFLKFYSALSTYEPEKSPLAYLFTIAKHLLINQQEKKSFTPVEESFFETHIEEASSILDDSHIRLLAENINTYLVHLTQDEQDVIRLYYYGEATYKEIADTLHKEEVYVRKLKERGLKKLRALTHHLYENA